MAEGISAVSLRTLLFLNMVTVLLTIVLQAKVDVLLEQKSTEKFSYIWKPMYQVLEYAF